MVLGGIVLGVGQVLWVQALARGQPDGNLLVLSQQEGDGILLLGGLVRIGSSIGLWGGIRIRGLVRVRGLVWVRGNIRAGRGGFLRPGGGCRRFRRGVGLRLAAGAGSGQAQAGGGQQGAKAQGQGSS